MIEDKHIATTLNEMILSMGAKLDQSLHQVKATCPEHEFVAYREFVSQVLTTMLADFMNPLYARHPDLKPPELT
ncbi:hypothetical protein BTK96_001960 [Burkholderia pyrrocinia]|uniref:hypothetical protein n=1 Tax=Burkholderia sp. IT-111MI5 TaxID=3026439 RepID=UPI002A34BB5E|nr:hypothetical protein [Burkholderia pyrrocinia]EKS9894616.1 hypothetical protein [Burkholderia pyrrocinia]EKS9906909.1 hypothetical protein [Burkholderia pyrrocinia]